MTLLRMHQVGLQLHQNGANNGKMRLEVVQAQPLLLFETLV